MTVVIRPAHSARRSLLSWCAREGRSGPSGPRNVGAPPSRHGSTAASCGRLVRLAFATAALRSRNRSTFCLAPAAVWPALSLFVSTA